MGITFDSRLRRLLPWAWPPSRHRPSWYYQVTSWRTSSSLRWCPMWLRCVTAPRWHTAKWSHAFSCSCRWSRRSCVSLTIRLRRRGLRSRLSSTERTWWTWTAPSTWIQQQRSRRTLASSSRTRWTRARPICWWQRGLWQTSPTTGRQMWRPRRNTATLYRGRAWRYATRFVCCLWWWTSRWWDRTWSMSGRCRGTSRRWCRSSRWWHGASGWWCRASGRWHRTSGRWRGASRQRRRASGRWRGTSWRWCRAFRQRTVTQKLCTSI